MKKNLFIVFFIMILISFSGCEKSTETPPKTDPNEPETPIEVPGNVDSSSQKIEDYYPLRSNYKYVYTGEGNEFASYTIFTDYLDPTRNRIQTRTNNGGTETVKVIEISEGKLSILLTKNESYYRDNLLNNPDMREDVEILLMEPLTKGTQWNITDNRVRRISDIDVEIQTPLGTYKALEVTTDGPNSVIKDYYVRDIGIVKTIFESENVEVVSTLSEVKTNTPFTKTIEIYYPNADGKIIPIQKTMSFQTNDISRMVIQEVMAEKVPQNTLLPIISPNTKINSLYLGQDNIAYIDFSKDLINDMNAGASYESLILQSIVNTIGNYYGVQIVYLTVENQPYESGHILLKNGETMKVNMDSVVR